MILKKIFEILNTNLDKEHFVNHDYIRGNYHIHLENDYVKYWNQKVLEQFVIKGELEETILLESNEVLEKANRGISYIGEPKPIDKRKRFSYHKR